MEEYTRKPNTKCLICNKPVCKRPGQIEKNKGNVFCGQSCFGLFCRREIPCVVCKKPILGGLHKKTCSRACSNTHRAGIQYKIGRPRDKAKTQYALKMRLLEKRGHACERCGYSRIKILHVHHKNRDRSGSKLANLELLCPNCHAEEHLLKNT